MNIHELKKITKKIRLEVLEMIHQAGSGHLGSSFSTAEMLVALYFGNLLKINPKKPNWEERDYFLLSNGHACPALYAILAYKGFFSKDELKKFRQTGSKLEGHPKRKSLPGIEISSGSLGMGLSQAVGIALGLKIKKKNNKVIVMMSDGEQQEGEVWEAAMAASHYKLKNLIAIIDRNGTQIGGFTEKQLALEPLKKKYESFGWRVIELNGHNFRQIFKAFNKQLKKDKPTVLISHTVGCRGISFMEGRADVHHPKVDDNFYQRALQELEKDE